MHKKIDFCKVESLFLPKTVEATGTFSSAVLECGFIIIMFSGLVSDGACTIPARPNSKIRLVLPLVAKTNNLEEGGAGKQV